ncbi:MAG: hypothetical protein OEZ32_10885 [Nitrospinota bacterium]|nr:hypothetical protein [Nitrospinota bacterium]
MKDPMARLREEAARKELERKAEKEHATEATGEEAAVDREVAEYLGAEEEEVAACCGSICPHCDMFLDKAIALVQLGRPHHLFMNPSQAEKFREAMEIYERDRSEYIARRQELMERMRR